MVEVSKNLFVGTVDEYDKNIRHGSEFYSAIMAKEPFHRSAVGYSARGCPKENPEYFIARRNRCIICNLIDVADMKYIPDEIVIEAVTYIRSMLCAGNKVFVCCNQGHSRSPMTALMALACEVPYNSLEFEKAYKKFEEIYTGLDASEGIYNYAKEKWSLFQNSDYCKIT